jgi:hypothetical protein
MISNTARKTEYTHHNQSRNKRNENSPDKRRVHIAAFNKRVIIHIAVGTFAECAAIQVTLPTKAVNINSIPFR